MSKPKLITDGGIDDTIERCNAQEMIRCAMDRTNLTERERIVLDLRFREGLTLREVAVRLGVSYECIRDREKHALKKLREALTDDGGEGQ